jgi:L-2-hydroxyglutarate oxidase LhgO
MLAEGTTVVDASAVGIVGGGIIGLATARELLSTRSGLQVTVLEKENELARHQTGRNSGVVHTGIYYEPGSLKARLCTRGRVLLKDYCIDRGLSYEECGKLVIATNLAEERRLRTILERATANGVPGVRLIGPGEITELEPHAAGSLALHTPRAAVVDFAAIARSFAKDVENDGGEIRTGAPVEDVDIDGDSVVAMTTAGRFRFDRLVVCAGLHTDVVAEMCGDDPEPRIIPFRGDYMELKPERTNLVRGLIYPVPDPRYPFLGVHLTRTVEGGVLVGPNALLALAREGYRMWTLDRAELTMTLKWPGFRAIARKHWRTGMGELYRALNRRAFVGRARRYVPALRYRDVVPARSGVRAQAVSRTGELVDDFRISKLGPVTAVRNAPSPAGTSSMAIAGVIAEKVLEQ